MECAIPHKVNLFLLFTTCVGNLHFVPQASQVAAGPPRTERGRNYLCMLIPYLSPPTLLFRILKGLEQNDFSFFFTLVIFVFAKLRWVFLFIYKVSAYLGNPQDTE